MSARGRKGSGKDFEEQFAALAVIARKQAEEKFPDAVEIQVTHYANDVIVTVWLPQATSAKLFKLKTEDIDLDSVDLTPPEPETEDADEFTVDSGVPIEA